MEEKEIEKMDGSREISVFFQNLMPTFFALLYV